MNCPFCNAALPNVTLSTCPRCLELLPRAKGAPAPAPVSAERTAERQQRAQLSLVRAVLVLGSMGVLGLFIGALYTLFAPSPPPAPPPPEPVRKAIPPHLWDGLAWLPDQVDVLVGVRVASVMDAERGPELLARLGLATNPNTGQVPATGGVNLEALTSFRASEIDQVLIGLCVADRLIPRLTIIVRRTQPFAIESVRQKLLANPAGTQRGKPAFRHRPPGVPLDLVFCQTDARTLALSLVPEHLGDLPAAATGQLQRFPDPLPNLLRAQLPADATVFAVARADDWQKTPLGVLYADGLRKSLPPAQWKALGQLRALAFSATLTDPVEIRAFGQVEQTGALAVLREWLDALKLPADWTTTGDQLHGKVCMPLADVRLPLKK